MIIPHRGCQKDYGSESDIVEVNNPNIICEYVYIELIKGAILTSKCGILIVLIKKNLFIVYFIVSKYIKEIMYNLSKQTSKGKWLLNKCKYSDQKLKTSTIFQFFTGNHFLMTCRYIIIFKYVFLDKKDTKAYTILYFTLMFR